MSPQTPELHPPPTFRLAELLAALSLQTDLGMGKPPEEAMRTCLLATGLARQRAEPEPVVVEIYWTALLLHVGCTAYAHEQATMFGGDEIAVNRLGSRTDFVDPRQALGFLVSVTKGMARAKRARVFVSGFMAGPGFGRRLATATCEVAAGMGRRLGLPEGVQRALGEMFERWDGRGDPAGLAGEEIAPAARYAQLAALTTTLAREVGSTAALEVVRGRAGASLDPDLARDLVLHGEELLDGIEAGDPWTAVLDSEPEPRFMVREEEIESVARAFGDVVDLKSRYTLGHSSGVAQLAAQAARLLGLPDAAETELGLAGHLHDLGRIGVPNGVWEKQGPLTMAEWEQVRLHPYHTERILSRSAVLAPLGTLAGLHHERLDGSGYHRRVSAANLPEAARVLAVADAFQAMTQPRPHRLAIARDDAASRLDAEARDGRLDRRIVDAVVAAAGLRREVHSTQPLPGGLTPRELEVLRHLVHGLTNRQMGRRLFISPKTVGRHIEHIYQKLGVTSRAAATLFAAEHGLIDPQWGGDSDS